MTEPLGSRTEIVERDRKVMAWRWGVPLEAVETDWSANMKIEDGQGGWQPFPAFKLAPGWKRVQEFVKVDEHQSYIATRYERVEGEG